MVRVAAVDFINLWNTHKIRIQKDRPHTTIGKPWFLYGYPEALVVDYSSIPNPKLIDSLSREVKAYNLDEYLSIVTLEWYYTKI